MTSSSSATPSWSSLVLQVAWERDPWALGCVFPKLILLATHESPLPPYLVMLEIHGSPLPPNLVLLELMNFPFFPCWFCWRLMDLAIFLAGLIIQPFFLVILMNQEQFLPFVLELEFHVLSHNKEADPSSSDVNYGSGISQK